LGQLATLDEIDEAFKVAGALDFWIAQLNAVIYHFGGRRTPC
jgi:hypothetical protein